MYVPALKVGDYKIFGYGLEKRRNNKLGIEEHYNAVSYYGKGYSVYAPRGVALQIKSTPYFPAFTFPVNEREGMVLFMQITRNGIVYSKGIFFAMDEFGETFTNVHSIRKINDETYWVEILDYDKNPVERTSGVWLTDGKHLWIKELGQTFVEATPPEFINKIKRFQTATIYKGRTYGRIGNDLVILDHWTKKKTTIKNVFKKVPTKIYNGTYFVPQYLFDRMIWGDDEW